MRQDFAAQAARDGGYPFAVQQGVDDQPAAHGEGRAIRANDAGQKRFERQQKPAVRAISRYRLRAVALIRVVVFAIFRSSSAIGGYSRTVTGACREIVKMVWERYRDLAAYPVTTASITAS